MQSPTSGDDGWTRRRNSAAGRPPRLVFTKHYDSGGNRKYKQPFGIYWMDIDGRRELLAWDAKISCNQSVPLAARPVPHLRPSVVDYRKDTGIFYVKDVYVGPGLSGVPRGTIKSLRVVALDFRAADIGSNGNSGPAGGALVSTPVSCRNGAWDVKVVLGTTPVYADGSAMFIVPARTPVYFQLLDEKNRIVQTMRSWSTLQPGEVFSCVGCHEPKSETAAPTDGPAIALARGPQQLEPFYGPSRGFSFPNEIQPILDKHCVRCHDDRARTIAGAAPPKVPLSAKDMKPILPIGGYWQYTTTDPKGGWQKPNFDSSKWESGAAGFGRKGTPGGTVCTDWHTSDIWLRQKFALPADWNGAAHSVALHHHRDEDLTVFINGTRVFVGKGHLAAYEVAAIDGAVLKPGENVIAVHCRQTEGGQFVDVGLLAAKPVPAGAAAPTKTLVAAATAPTETKKAFSLLAERTVDKGAKRLWSDSYLALTKGGKPNRIVNWLNVQSIPPMLPPYFAGAAKSDLMTMLEQGHYNVKLGRQELDKIACWIDLLVPFCGDYVEANAWTDADKDKYSRFQAKRDRMEAVERANIAALIAAQTGRLIKTAPQEAPAPAAGLVRGLAGRPPEPGGVDTANSQKE